jgi:hypothetical protein
MAATPPQLARDPEPPLCAACHIGMQWFRADLVPGGQERPDLIAHVFQCPKCHSIEIVRTPREGGGHGQVPPDSVPFSGAA